MRLDTSVTQEPFVPYNNLVRAKYVDAPAGSLLLPLDERCGKQIKVTVAANDGQHDMLLTLDGEYAFQPIFADEWDGPSHGLLVQVGFSIDVDFASARAVTSDIRPGDFLVGEACTGMGIVPSRPSGSRFVALSGEPSAVRVAYSRWRILMNMQVGPRPIILEFSGLSVTKDR